MRNDDFIDQHPLLSHNRSSGIDSRLHSRDITRQCRKRLAAQSHGEADFDKFYIRRLDGRVGTLNQGSHRETLDDAQCLEDFHLIRPANGGKMASWTFGITKESITEKLPALSPAVTLA